MLLWCQIDLQEPVLGVFEIIQHIDVTEKGSVANTDSTP